MFVVIDIETTGLNRYKDKINVCGVYVPGRDQYYQPTDREGFLRLLASFEEKPHMIWANGKFDTLFLEQQWSIPAEFLTIDDDIMIITGTGVIIRIHAKDISVLGRNTQGVTLMRTSEGGKVVNIAKLVSEEEQDNQLNLENM